MIATLIWAVYAGVVAILFAVASIFVHVYQTPRDRSPLVTLTCTVAITSLLATILLLPVDVALVSSTVSSAVGQRRDWATQEVVDSITFSLTLVHYILYSLDILLCLLVVPFVYFWYEEYDEVAAQAGEQSFGQRFWGALKYTLSFVAIAIILFLIGFFVPFARKNGNDGLDLFKSTGSERALTFALGLLSTIGMCIYVMYTSTGLAVLPTRLIKRPLLVSPVQLESNRERQRQLQGRCGGNPELLSHKDRRELDALVREERTLIRRQRLVEADQPFLVRAWSRIETFLCPSKLLIGLILFLVVLLTWVSMLLAVIKPLYGGGNIFNPINQILVQSAKVFPIDYVIFTMLALLFFSGTVAGIATIGIRFLWISIFQVRKGHTSPQAFLFMTTLLMLGILALNYSMSMIVAPQYATFGPQTFCSTSDCTETKHLVQPCSKAVDNDAARRVCTPSVASTVLNRVTIHFPLFGAILFWGQFVFLGIHLLALLISLLRSPNLDERQLDEDAEEAEEEALLASSRRNTNTRWQNVIGRASRREAADESH
ncbi:hypothetical protein BDW74DRAFT_157882 [Aspergillus multicolor]|uniref:putative LMBR1 domain protein n=1 Tax=Aspergillus multicolor TaxID=41759 RepID=UPI003CCCC809